MLAKIPSEGHSKQWRRSSRSQKLRLQPDHSADMSAKPRQTESSRRDIDREMERDGEIWGEVEGDG